uniref:Uncharacterized protein n=1 Tax=Chromera velia CCMP2878 TaxID=1169474 RepID=A0A0G4FH63_9ALVE|eukprot:Cvel_17001.t1-p1 / transcript=Cvel_17001.t1 / gene=Cvel_17001 / organism=Chromera_velia_CCMP2878 / gene_product=hypothetical protein / transcript_product=hypothetical protein / location=Cvel_scaffold1336:13572-17125(-) / protein_length=874 / sequence_SO=supercontig / SO=protein_coding / is_pseudo=false
MRSHTNGDSLLWLDFKGVLHITAAFGGVAEKRLDLGAPRGGGCPVEVGRLALPTGGGGDMSQIAAPSSAPYDRKRAAFNRRRLTFRIARSRATLGGVSQAGKNGDGETEAGGAPTESVRSLGRSMSCLQQQSHKTEPSAPTGRLQITDFLVMQAGLTPWALVAGSAEGTVLFAPQQWMSQATVYANSHKHSISALAARLHLVVSCDVSGTAILWDATEDPSPLEVFNTVELCRGHPLVSVPAPRKQTQQEADLEEMALSPRFSGAAAEQSGGNSQKHISAEDLSIVSAEVFLLSPPRHETTSPTVSPPKGALQRVQTFRDAAASAAMRGVSASRGFDEEMDLMRHKTDQLKGQTETERAREANKWKLSARKAAVDPTGKKALAAKVQLPILKARSGVSFKSEQRALGFTPSRRKQGGKWGELSPSSVSAASKAGRSVKGAPAVLFLCAGGSLVCAVPAGILSTRTAAHMAKQMGQQSSSTSGSPWEAAGSPSKSNTRHEQLLFQYHPERLARTLLTASSPGSFLAALMEARGGRGGSTIDLFGGSQDSFASLSSSASGSFVSSDANSDGEEGDPTPPPHDTQSGDAEGQEGGETVGRDKQESSAEVEDARRSLEKRVLARGLLPGSWWSWDALASECFLLTPSGHASVWKGPLPHFHKLTSFRLDPPTSADLNNTSLKRLRTSRSTSRAFNRSIGRRSKVSVASSRQIKDEKGTAVSASERKPDRRRPATAPQPPYAGGNRPLAVHAACVRRTGIWAVAWSSGWVQLLLSSGEVLAIVGGPRSIPTGPGSLCRQGTEAGQGRTAESSQGTQPGTRTETAAPPDGAAAGPPWPSAVVAQMELYRKSILREAVWGAVKQSVSQSVTQDSEQGRGKE